MTMPDTGQLEDLTWEYDQAGRTLTLTGPLEEAEALGILGAVALLPPEEVAGPAELAAQVRGLVAELRSMRPVDAPRRRERRPIDGSKALLTKTEAARALGVCRKTTLRKLIETRAIRTVPGPRGCRIPRSEIERLLEEGIPAPGTARRPPRRGPKGRAPSRGVGDRIMRIPVRPD